MRILITGAAGNIGSLLGYSLYKDGHELILIDNFRSGRPENLIYNGISFGNFYEIDIRNTNELSYILKKHNIESVIHLAAISSLPECEINKIECLSNNVIGTESVIEACRINGIKKIIFSSSSGVYENNDQILLKEDLEVSPTLYYTMSKKMSEDICQAYSKQYGMNIKILRLFNVISPRQDIFRSTPSLIGYLVKSFMNNESPKLNYDGTQSRDYISVFDIINLIKILLIKETPYNVFNVCNNKLTSVNDIVKYIKDEIKINIEPNYIMASESWNSYEQLFDLPYPLNKERLKNQVNKEYLGDNSRIIEIGWIPEKSIEDSIKQSTRLIIDEYFKNKE